MNQLSFFFVFVYKLDTLETSEILSPKMELLKSISMTKLQNSLASTPLLAGVWLFMKMLTIWEKVEMKRARRREMQESALDVVSLVFHSNF